MHYVNPKHVMNLFKVYLAGEETNDISKRKRRYYYRRNYN